MSEGVPFGNYRLQRRLARGGMAEVFLARHVGVEGFERRVAIKRILPHLSDSDEFRSMFLDEARLAAQLTHPNVVHIYDFGKFDDYYFIAMEYLDGIDLGRIIRQAKAKPVPFELAARILADVCSGLHYAHHVSDATGKPLEVVHRDVTPQNILVTWDGVVKLVDFGIAKATWQAGRTRPGVVKGKYAYMSPEQVEGRTLDSRSDIFSAGICLFELLTGVPLFRRDNVTEAMKEIRDGKPIQPEQHRPGVPPPMMAILKRALSTLREERYATASEMQMDLERYLKGAKELATPALLGEFLVREVPRPPEGELLVAEEPKPKSGPRPATDPESPTPVGAEALTTPGKGAVAPVTTPGKGGVALVGRAERRSDRAAALNRESGGQQSFADAADEEHTRRARGSGPQPAQPGAASAEDAAVTVDERAAQGQGEDADATLVHRTTPSGGVAPLDPAPAAGAAEEARGRGASKGARDARSSWPVTHVLLAIIGGAGALLYYRPWLRDTPPAPTPPSVEPLAPEPPKPEMQPVVTPLATPLPVRTSAGLDIRSRPTGAKVIVDGRVLPSLTPIRAMEFLEGPHHIIVERPGYQPRELDVDLQTGERRTLDLELREAKSTRKSAHSGGSGTLTVRTKPWSNVYEGSTQLGVTPFANVPLTEGAHTLTFANPDLPSVQKRVVIKMGQETKLNFELQP
jgi:serine/threonine-protein kinase